MAEEPQPPNYREWLPTGSRRKRPRAAWVTEAQASSRRAVIRVLTQSSKVPFLRPPSDALMRRLFDSLAPSWDKIREEPVYRDAFMAALASGPKLTGQPFLFNSPGWPQRALDVACGTGHASAWLKERCPQSRLSGVDISPKMVEIAAAAVPGLAVRVGSGADLPYDDASFELVTSLDGVFATSELARVCAPNGAVLIVYSKGASCPVVRDVDHLAAELTAAGMQAVSHKESWWCVWAVWPPTQP